MHTPLCLEYRLQNDQWVKWCIEWQSVSLVYDPRISSNGLSNGPIMNMSTQDILGIFI